MGYIVRGKDAPGQPARGTCYGYATEGLTSYQFASLSGAIEAVSSMAKVGCTDVRIFAVGADGTETPLPTYEEALSMLDKADDAIDACDVVIDRDGTVFNRNALTAIAEYRAKRLAGPKETT
jgi:hypothetical protein